MNANSPDVVNATTENFQQLAVERSKELLVLVDFWAAWCKPCTMLSPLLDALAARHTGKLAIVKVDIDSEPQLAGAFSVQSIPAVYALRDGAVVDGFVGVLSEKELEAFVERLLPTPAQELLAEAKHLQESDPSAAESALRRALELDPKLDAARIALAHVLIAQDQIEAAKEVIERLEARGYMEPEAERVRAELDVRLAGRDAGNIEPLRQAVEAAPEDWTARFKLGEALAAAGQHQEALDHLLLLVQRDRHATGEQARQLMIDIFRLLPDDSELVHEYRRKLSAALY